MNMTATCCRMAPSPSPKAEMKRLELTPRGAKAKAKARARPSQRVIATTAASQATGRKTVGQTVVEKKARDPRAGNHAERRISHPLVERALRGTRQMQQRMTMNLMEYG